MIIFSNVNYEKTTNYSNKETFTTLAIHILISTLTFFNHQTINTFEIQTNSHLHLIFKYFLLFQFTKIMNSKPFILLGLLFSIVILSSEDVNTVTARDVKFSEFYFISTPLLDDDTYCNNVVIILLLLVSLVSSHIYVDSNVI